MLYLVNLVVPIDRISTCFLKPLIQSNLLNTSNLDDRKEMSYMLNCVDFAIYNHFFAHRIALHALFASLVH